ncbi:MAG: GntR family transcriptional regulator [Erysipelotrichaceae bacterium]|nr:GntR family transcriptional regulator [Erysipelotrichaceae bacterium]
MIDRHSALTAYEQVKEDIKYKIAHDVYKIGDQIPTNVQLCDVYDVSRITINRALADLESEGYIERFQGKGCFVKMKEISQNMSRFYSFTEELRKMGYEPHAKIISYSIIPANEEMAQALDISVGEDVVYLKRLRYADDVIVTLDRSYLPLKCVPNFDVSMITGVSLYEAIEKNYGFKPNHSEETIEAININADDARLMGVKEDTPILLVRRVSYFNDKKVEFNYRLVNSKVFKYKMSLE